MSSFTYRIGSNQVEADKKCQFRDLNIQSNISCMEATSTVVAFVKEERNMFISFPAFQLTYISDESIKSLSVSSQYIISIRGDASVEILRFNLENETIERCLLINSSDGLPPLSAVFSVSSSSIAAIVYRNKVVVLLLDCFSGMTLYTSDLAEQTGVTVYDYTSLCNQNPIVGIVLDERELKYVATEHTLFEGQTPVKTVNDRIVHSLLSPDGKSSFLLSYPSADDASRLEAVHITHRALLREEATTVAVVLKYPCRASDLRLVACSPALCCLWCVHSAFLVVLSFAEKAVEAVDVVLPFACDCLSMVKREARVTVQVSQKAWVRVMTLDLTAPGLFKSVAEGDGEGRSVTTPDSTSLLTDSLLPQVSLRTDYAGSLLDEDIDYNDIDSIPEAVHDESDSPAVDSDSARPVDNSVEESVDNPMEECVDPVEEPMDNPVDESVDNLVDESVDPVDESVGNPVEEPMDNPMEEAGEESMDDYLDESLLDSSSEPDPDSANDAETASASDRHADEDTEDASPIKESDSPALPSPKPIRMYKPHRSRSPPRNMHPAPEEKPSSREIARLSPACAMRLISHKSEAKNVAIPAGAMVIDITGQSSEEVSALLEKSMKKDIVLRNQMRIDLPSELMASPTREETTPGVLDLLNSGDGAMPIENQPVSSAADLFDGICGVAPATPAQEERLPEVLRIEPRAMVPVEPLGGLEALPATPVQFPGREEKEKPAKPSVKPPAKAPVKPPVKTPAKTPVKTPVKTLVKAPVKTPAKPPVKTPVKTPVKAPVKTPAKAPVKPLAKPAKKAKKAKQPVVPVVPVKTVHSDEVQPVASAKVEYTPLTEVPALKTAAEKELFGLVTVNSELLLARLQSMLQQYCTLCYNGKATLIKEMRSTQLLTEAAAKTCPRAIAKQLASLTAEVQTCAAQADASVAARVTKDLAAQLLSTVATCMINNVAPTIEEAINEVSRVATAATGDAAKDLRVAVAELQEQVGAMRALMESASLDGSGVAAVRRAIEEEAFARALELVLADPSEEAWRVVLASYDPRWLDGLDNGLLMRFAALIAQRLEGNAEKDLEMLLDVVFEYKRTGEEDPVVRESAKKVVQWVQKWREGAELPEEVAETADDVCAFFSRV